MRATRSTCALGELSASFAHSTKVAVSAFCAIEQGMCHDISSLVRAISPMAGNNLMRTLFFDV